MRITFATESQRLINETYSTFAPGYKPGSWQFRAYAEAGKFPIDVPVGEFTAEQRHALLYGEPENVQYLGFSTTYQGLIPRLESSLLSKEREGLQKAAREFVERAVTQVECPDCAASGKTGSETGRYLSYAGDLSTH